MRKPTLTLKELKEFKRELAEIKAAIVLASEPDIESRIFISGLTIRLADGKWLLPILEAAKSEIEDYIKNAN